MDESTKNEREIRLEKLKELRANGFTYKGNFNKTHKTIDVVEMDSSKFRGADEVLEKPKDEVGVAGRILTIRDHGGILFIDIQDRWGELQIAFTEKVLGADGLEHIRKYFDLGDFIGVSGEPFITKQDKLAVLTSSYELLTKALNPLPTQHFGLADTDTRYRKRYLDLIVNKEVKDRFEVRSKVVQSLRDWLLENDFVEVVTRTLQPIAGGAMAETFVTHHNALDYDFNLRISNELDLKMAVAGGFERVFEFSIDFRNEGIDSSHLQEFQMLEWYCSYADYKTGIEYTKQLLKKAVIDATGDSKVKIKGRDDEEFEVDFAKDIPTVTFASLLEKEGIDINADRDTLFNYAKEKNLEIENIEKRSRGNLLDDIYKKVIRPKIQQPIFIEKHPADMFPLARRNDEDDTLVDSYQLVIATWEIVKGYSELVDPEQQKAAFDEQAKAKVGGDSEAMDKNDEFVTAMEHGMPPITGFGLGIDRFVSLITGTHNLKETVLFPLMLPKNDD